MGWLFYVITIGFFILWGYWVYCTDIKEWYGRIIVAILQAVIIFVLWFMTLFIFLIPPEYPREECRTETENIYSLGLNETVSGKFRFGIGNIEGKTIYRFYSKNKDGYILKEVDASKTTLVETDSVPPHIKYIKSYKYTGDVDWKARAFWGIKCESAYRVYSSRDCFIYIPKGSIIQTFEIRP